MDDLTTLCTAVGMDSTFDEVSPSNEDYMYLVNSSPGLSPMCIPFTSSVTDSFKSPTRRKQSIIFLFPCSTSYTYICPFIHCQCQAKPSLQVETKGQDH